MKNSAPFLFYFFLFAALSALLPYLVIYYDELGLSGPQIGILTSIGPLISLFGAPMWSGVADLTRRHRLILSLNGLAAAGLVLLYPSASGFPALLILVALFSLAFSPVGSLADSAVMFMLKGDSGRYGRMRMGGTFGWGLVAPLAGMMIDRQGSNWMFWGFAVLFALALITSQLLRYPQQSEAGTDLRLGLRTLLADRRWLMVLAMLFFGGFGMASITTYLFLHMKALGASQSLMGLTLTLATLSEIPTLFFVNRLTRRLSPHNMLLLALAAATLRTLLTGLAGQPVWAAAAQLIHGLTFPVFWVAGVSFAHHNSPAGMFATAQGLMGTVFSGLGPAVGAFAGGILIGAIGGSGLFLSYAGILFLALIFFATRRGAAVVSQA